MTCIVRLSVLTAESDAKKKFNAVALKVAPAQTLSIHLFFIYILHTTWVSCGTLTVSKINPSLALHILALVQCTIRLGTYLTIKDRVKSFRTFFDLILAASCQRNKNTLPDWNVRIIFIIFVENINYRLKWTRNRSISGQACVFATAMWSATVAITS